VAPAVRRGAWRIFAGIAIAAALFGTARAAGDASPAFAWQPTRAKNGPRPRCFAYAPSLRGYACVGYADEGQGRRQVVDVVGLGRRGAVVRSHALPKADADRWLTELGFAPVVPHGARLPSGQWVAAGAARLRFELRPHDGDASFENYGDVTVGCPDGRGIALDVRKRGLELGDDAWVFWQSGSGVIAISVAGLDGGEDTIYRWVNTLVVDVSVLCAGGTAAVAGPVQGRSVGP